MLAIQTEQLTEKFKSHTAVKALDLQVPAGPIYGFLGPNGSGKSTTMKMILGLSQPTHGNIKIFNTLLTPQNREKWCGGWCFMLLVGLLNKPPCIAGGRKAAVRNIHRILKYLRHNTPEGFSREQASALRLFIKDFVVETP